MDDVFGLAAFGLGDTCTGTKTVRGPEYIPSSVILPRSWRGKFVTGKMANDSRVETGLMWPQEARVSDTTVLRRVPVGLLWAKLVQDGDRTSYWTPGAGGARSATATVLHEHFAYVLQTAGWIGQPLVVAIPNALDEMGQEDLLRSFGEARENVQLIWRPVAAAMQWLQGLGKDFRIRAGDWMLVMYMGPDFFEATSFALQHDEETGYPVPVRSRGRRTVDLTGFDWAWSCCAGENVGEIWQQLLRFPQVWQALVDKRLIRDGRKLWSRQDGSWEIWEAEQKLVPAQSVRAWGSAWLSSQLARKQVQKSHSWAVYFASMLEQERQRSTRRGRLRGVVYCGPLVPAASIQWLGRLSDFTLSKVSRTPEPDTIWLPSRSGIDIIAAGAQLYGERLREHLPTYLDTLPGLKILSQDRRRHYIWQSLVDATTCKGGQEYTNAVQGFSYQKRHPSLTAILQKENEDNYRREVVPLPFAPVENIPIDIRVRMKPASGLAQVRLVTFDDSVEELLFDFSRMEEVTDLPKPQLFCPDDGHRTLSIFSGSDRQSFLRECNVFLRSPGTLSSLEYFDTLRNHWLLPSKQYVVVDEQGKTLEEFEDALTSVSRHLLAICKSTGELTPRLARLASSLWGMTPEAFRMELVRRFRLGAGMDKDFVEAAGRCFATGKECRLLLSHIVNKELKFAYALNAAFTVLHYRPEAYGILDDRITYGLLRIALVMMEEQRKEKKVKFRNAASLIFVLLKYRLKSGHMNFLGDNDKLANRFAVRQRLERYINEIDEELGSLKRIDMATRTLNNLKRSRKYLHDIVQYIKYKGDPSAVPLLEESSS